MRGVVGWLRWWVWLAIVGFCLFGDFKLSLGMFLVCGIFRGPLGLSGVKLICISFCSVGQY